MDPSATLDVQVWSDIACPWCYVGKRRFEAALARFSHRDAVKLTWRSFELDPTAPRVRERVASYAERLAKKYGMSVAQAEGRIRQLTDLAATEGLELRFDRIRSGNTFDAHRLLHLAAERGLQDSVKERFLSAHFTEGEAIGDPETLARLANLAGLDPDEVRAVLATDVYASNVRSEEEQAHALGIHGVPFFLVGRRRALGGAPPADAILEALDQAWADTAQKAADLSGAGADRRTDASD
jgi:predicted DsbA family dithiol-disulfide isomerase